MKRKLISVNNPSKRRKFANADGTKSHHGGARPGAGRKAGVPSKKGAALEAAVQKCMDAVLKLNPNAKAVDLWQALYRNPKTPLNVRLEAMKRAEKFETPSLSPTEMTDPNAGNQQSRVSSARAELARKLLALPAAPSGAEVARLA